MPIRLVVADADDASVVRKDVEALVQQVPDVEVVARCQRGEATLQPLRQHRPDVVVLTRGGRACAGPRPDTASGRGEPAGDHNPAPAGERPARAEAGLSARRGLLWLSHGGAQETVRAMVGAAGMPLHSCPVRGACGLRGVAVGGSAGACWPSAPAAVAMEKAPRVLYS